MRKQFNLSGVNGLYLTNRPFIPVDLSNYLSQLLTDTDLFPKTTKDATLYSFKNARYLDPGKVVGSNSVGQSNSALMHSEFIAPNALIMNEFYYNKFTMYFNFSGSQLFGYTPDGGSISGADFGVHLNKLRLKLYAQLGSNTISLKLSNFRAIDPAHTPVLLKTVSGTTYNTATKTGFRQTVGLNGEDCIDLGWKPIGDTIGDRMNAFDINGFTYSIDAEIPNFTSITKGYKDYKIIVKYLNIAITGVTGVSTTAYPYTTDEAIELMANNYVWYQGINPGDSTAVGVSSIGGVLVGGITGSSTTGGFGGGGFSIGGGAVG